MLVRETPRPQAQAYLTHSFVFLCQLHGMMLTANVRSKKKLKQQSTMFSIHLLEGPNALKEISIKTIHFIGSKNNTETLNEYATKLHV